MVLLTLSGGLAALVTPPLMSDLQLDPAAVAQVRAASPSASSIAAERGVIQGFGRVARVVGAVERDRRRGGGAMLPRSSSRSRSVSRSAPETNARNEVVLFFRAPAESMLTLVRWLLVVAPLGVFALAGAGRAPGPRRGAART